MASKFRGIDVDPGWIRREFADIRRQVREMNAAKRVPRATFPDGVIPMSALASAAAPGAVASTETAFGVSLGGASVLSRVVTVPER